MIITTKKKLTKRKKYKSGRKTNLSFFILHCSLMMIFLFLLSNKTEQPEDTSMPYNCIISLNFFSLYLLEILDIITNRFLRCQFSCFTLPNIHLHKYDSFFRFILLLSGDINVNPDSTTVNNNNVPLNALPFYSCNEPTKPSECNSSDYAKEHDDSKWNIFKNRLAYFTS